MGLGQKDPVDVLCLEKIQGAPCHKVYETTVELFHAGRNRCPRCHGWRGQHQNPPHIDTPEYQGPDVPEALE